MNARNLSVLVVAEDQKRAETILNSIGGEGIRVSRVQTGTAALETITQEDFAVVIMAHGDTPGLEPLKAIKIRKPETQILIVSPHKDDLFLRSIQNNGFTFLNEPYCKADLLQMMDRACEHYQSLMEIRRLKSEINKLNNHADVIGTHPKIKRINEIIENAAFSDCPVLIRGKSGTGKELTARAIHKRSRRADAPFELVNCGVFTETALEQELFGQEAGSPHRVERIPGRIESAAGGTLFLDEIDTMSPALQEKLLRSVLKRSLLTVGGTNTAANNFRLVAATTCDLEQLVFQKLFLPDLYEHLKVICITLPELAEHGTDIPLLANYFLERYQPSGAAKSIAPAAMDLLVRYRWPGNVRELMNAVEYGLVMAKGDQIMPSDLPEAIQGTAESRSGSSFPSLRETERELIVRTLKECGGNKHLTAKRLRIPRSTLYSKIQKHGITIDGKSGLVQYHPDETRAAGSF